MIKAKLAAAMLSCSINSSFQTNCIRWSASTRQHSQQVISSILFENPTIAQTKYYQVSAQLLFFFVVAGILNCAVLVFQKMLKAYTHTHTRTNTHTQIPTKHKSFISAFYINWMLCDNTFEYLPFGMYSTHHHQRPPGTAATSNRNSSKATLNRSSNSRSHTATVFVIWRIGWKFSKIYFENGKWALISVLCLCSNSAKGEMESLSVEWEAR